MNNYKQGQALLFANSKEACNFFKVVAQNNINFLISEPKYRDANNNLLYKIAQLIANYNKYVNTAVDIVAVNIKQVVTATSTRTVCELSVRYIDLVGNDQHLEVKNQAISDGKLFTTEHTAAGSIRHELEVNVETGISYERGIEIYNQYTALDTIVSLDTLLKLKEDLRKIEGAVSNIPTTILDRDTNTKAFGYAPASPMNFYFLIAAHFTESLLLRTFLINKVFYRFVPEAVNQPLLAEWADDTHDTIHGGAGIKNGDLAVVYHDTRYNIEVKNLFKETDLDSNIKSAIEKCHNERFLVAFHVKTNLFYTIKVTNNTLKPYEIIGEPITYFNFENPCPISFRPALPDTFGEMYTRIDNKIKFIQGE